MWELLLPCSGLTNLLSRKIFVQRAAPPTGGGHRWSHQGLIHPGAPHMQAISLYPPEEFLASLASPFAVTPHRFLPRTGFGKADASHRWGTFSRAVKESDMTGY